MNKKSLLSVIVICVLISSTLIAQVTTPSNNSAIPPQYVGWNGTTFFSKPLDIKNNFAAQDINFFTNQTGANGSSINRMVIKGSGANLGFVGMSNNLPAGFTPQAHLHIHRVGAGNANMRFTNAVIGSTATSGLEIGITSTGDAYFNNYQINRSFLWNNGATTPYTRMRLYDGGVGQQNGRLAISDDLPAAFVPVDRHVLYESIATGSVQTRYQNNTTGVTANDGYAIGVNNTASIPNDRIVNHTQFENRAMRWLSPNSRTAGAITEWMRIQNNATSVLNASNTTDGYIGLNNPAPDFHLDAITPAIAGDELFNSFRTSDVPNSRMGMINGTVSDGLMAPTFYGSLVEPSQTAYGLQTLGSITDATDVGTNPTAVTWFRSGKNWVPNSGNPFDELDPVENRYAFAWVNGSNIKMHMNARGQVRIGDSLVSGIVGPARNRLEVSANVSDPHGADISVNGASGIRLTHLTALKTPYAVNPGTGVLGVDTAGNIIYVPANTGTTLGNLCVNTPNPITGDWEIPLGTATTGYNYVFSGQGASKYNVGIGTTCSPNAKLDILESSGANATTALNVINKDLYGIGINVAAIKGPYGVYSVASYADPVTLKTVGGLWRS